MIPASRSRRPGSFNDAPANCRGRLDKASARQLRWYLLQRCPGELPGETAWLQPIVYLSETAQIASAAETSHGPRPERLVLVCRLSKNMMHLNEL